MSFNEHALEMSIMKLFENKGYTHMTGANIVREKSEVLLLDDLRSYLRERYKKDNITESEILLAVSKKYEFEYPEDKMLELSKEIKIVVDDKAKYTDWSTREDIKANLQVDLIILLDKYDYPPVTIDDVYKEVLEQAENFKKYAK